MSSFAPAISPSDAEPSMDPTDPSGQAAKATAMMAAMVAQKVDLFLPFMIGSWLDALCLGVLLILWARWLAYVRPTDSFWTRVLVYYLMMPTLISTTTLLAKNYDLFATNFGDYLRLVDMTLVRRIPVSFVLSRVPAAAFFAIRAWRLNGKPMWLPIVLAPCFIACIVGGVLGTKGAYTVPLPRLALDGILIYSSAEVVSDIIITSCLFYGLMKSKSGWAHTDRLVKRLMRLMLETQTPPAATAIVFLIISLTKGDGTALGYFIFYTKIHVLCLMAVVTARVELSQQGRGGTYKSSCQSKGSIRVTTVTQQHRDDMSVRGPAPGIDRKGDEVHNSTTELVHKQSLV